MNDVGAGFRARTIERLHRVLYSVNAWTALCVALGAALAFVDRHKMNPDGLSYIEIGQTALRTGPRGLVNAYWSPGYPALVAAAFALVRPGSAAEFPVVHALNFAILVATVFVFRRLVRSWLGEHPAAVQPLASPALVPIAFGMFVMIAFSAVGPALVTPDLAVLATTLFIVLAYQRLRTSARWWAACALGAACAIGYWMKTAMLPLGALLFCLLFVAPPPIERVRAKLGLAVGVWLLLSFPLIGLISAKLGRVSYGESGHLNYAWFVNNETPFGSASQVHGPRVVQAVPKVIEFGTPVPGTFPLWYDPSYWAEGTATHFDVRAQARAFASNTIRYANQWLADYQAVVAVLIALTVIRGTRVRDPAARKRKVDVLLLWGIGWLGLYAMVATEPRYVAPAVLLVVFSIMRMLLPDAPGVGAFRVSVVAAAFVLLKTASVGVRTLSEIRSSRQPAYLELADRLRAIGLTPESRIAIVGIDDGYGSYYAHAAGLRVTAAVVDSTDRLPLTKAALDQVRAALTESDIKAVVRPSGPVEASDPTWRRIELSDGTVAGVVLIARR